MVPIGIISHDAPNVRHPVLRTEDGPCQDVLTCPVCCEIPLDPIVTTPCDHIFCRGCVEQAITLRRECPSCRQSLTMRNLTAIQGPLRRIWERIPVSCPVDRCQWTGTIGNYSAHASICGQSCAPGDLDRLEKRVRDLVCAHQAELDEIGNRHRNEMATLSTQYQREIQQLKQRFMSFDPSYRYDCHQIVGLTKLICRDLESCPPHIDSNRIFNCVKKCYDDFTRGWSDNPEYMDMNVRMLLNVCRASGWFTYNQDDCFDRWCNEQEW